MSTGQPRYLGWIAHFQTPNYEVQGFGDTQSEALIMLRSALAAHVRRSGADPGYLDEYIEDVDYRQLVVPSGVIDGTVVTTLPTPPPTVQQIVEFATDPGLGSPVRVTNDDDPTAADYGNAWSLLPGVEWHHSPDVFSYDEVCRMLTDIGIAAYPEQTGGGFGTIYAGPLVEFQNAYGRNDDGTMKFETERRYKVAAGPGVYGWDRGDSVGSVEEFYMGPNDDGESDSVGAADLAVTNTRQLAAYIALLVIDAADFDNVTAIGLDATQRGIPQNGA